MARTSKKACKRVVVDEGEGWERPKWTRGNEPISVSTFRKRNPGISLRGLTRKKPLILNEGAGGLFRVRCSR